MSNYPKATSLREPPKVGETYLVWTIRFPRDDCDWPIHVPAHECNPGTGYHYHHDPRFFTEEQEADMAYRYHTLAANAGYRMAHVHDSSRVADSNPGLAGGLVFSTGPRAGEEWVAPILKPLVCRHSTVPWDVQERDHYYSNARARIKGLLICFDKAVRTPSGRILCPHKMFDLTSHIDPDSGATRVRCPLHGLMVRL